ncbi:hypothetical protein ACEZDB_12315 [Streptacidiphilus sp. N1-3]|uniref:Uncharacterized protein n=1 Tax=Streptacidiphilus alkalitolerans TaxID=3342712 RepID=A0ABV6WZN9_9ACTN
MSTNRSRRIDRDTAERLLGGVRGGTTDGHDALAGVLAAAAAPAAEGELSGERAAVAAFRAARLAPAPATRKRPMLTSGLARLLSAKAAAAVLATAFGGVAVAAGTGHLPAALGGGPGSGGAVPTTTASATARAGERATAPAGTADRSPTAVPSDLAVLCRAFAQAGSTDRGGVPAERRFTPLVAAAGGPARVPDYCAPVLGDRGSGPDSSPTAGPSGRPSTAMTQPGKRAATGRPSSPGASHRSAAPSSRPTGKPSVRPGAVPSPPGKRTATAHPTG